MPSSPVNTKDDPPYEPSKVLLLNTLGVYYRGCLWTLTWHQDKGVEGFTLNGYEIRLLGLDLTHVMRQIASVTRKAAKKSRPPLDYWSEAVEKFAYRLPGGDLLWEAPGYDIPEGGVVERVKFRAHPKQLPFSDIMESLRRYGRPLGLNVHSLLFFVDEIAIENACLMHGIIKAEGLKPRGVVKSLRKWRTSVLAMVDSAAPVAQTPEPQQPQAVGGDELIPPEVRGLVLARPMLAKAMRKSTRTLKNWDDAGCVPTGVKWCPADKVSGNVALYVVGRNWKAIVSMLPEGRDLDADRQLAEELFRMKNSDDEGPASIG